jgi:hypothetical protein
MSQPCGRVLDLPAKYSFWMRCSPIICIVDSIHWIAFLVADFIMNLWSHRHRDRRLRAIAIDVLRSHLKYRFRQGDRDEVYPAESLLEDPDVSKRPQSPQRGTFIRLSILGLSGIPCQTIKLVAMKGIPWTQTWALMYFTSIVIGEVLCVLGKPVSSSGQHEPLAPLRVHATRAWRLSHKALLGAAACHASIVFYYFCVIFDTLLIPRKAVLVPVLYAMMLLGMLSLIFFGAHFSGHARNTPISNELTGQRIQIAFGLVCIGAFLSVATRAFQQANELISQFPGPEGDFPWPLRIWLIICNIIWRLWVWAISLMLSFFSTLAIPVLPVLGVFVQKQQGWDISDIFVLPLWLLTVLVALFYYCVLYDSAGTVNPEWVWVFG